MKTFNVELQSFVTDTMKEIRSGADKQRKLAARHVREKIKSKALAIKVTGNLAKGVYDKHTKNSSFVGIKAPHAFLVEFGSWKSSPRMTKGKGKYRKKIRSVGTMPANPIVYPTFAEEEKEVERILSETWVK